MLHLILLISKLNLKKQIYQIRKKIRHIIKIKKLAKKVIKIQLLRILQKKVSINYRKFLNFTLEKEKEEEKK